MLRNCEECNRVFSHPTRRLCVDCFEKRQEAFNKVKDYLKEHPNASVAQVSVDTEVELETIYEFIREGRLPIIPRDVDLRCEICDAPISVGRVCSKCRAELQGEKVRPVQQKREQGSTASRVHYLDRIRDRR